MTHIPQKPQVTTQVICPDDLIWCIVCRLWMTQSILGSFNTGLFYLLLWVKISYGSSSDTSEMQSSVYIGLKTVFSTEALADLS